MTCTAVVFFLVDGRWQSWTTWGSCSKTCGGGLQQRQRMCEGPMFGGEPCPGDREEKRRCNERRCPGHYALHTNKLYFGGETGNIFAPFHTHNSVIIALTSSSPEPHEICPEELTGDVVWKRTPAGDMAAVTCPIEASGTLTGPLRSSLPNSNNAAHSKVRGG